MSTGGKSILTGKTEENRQKFPIFTPSSAKMHNFFHGSFTSNPKFSLTQKEAAYISSGNNTYSSNIQKKYTVVCRHWLKNNCYKGKNCEYLHQYDKERIPECLYSVKGLKCYDVECIFKHDSMARNNTKNNTTIECKNYKYGFCINGPACKYAHVKESESKMPEELPDWYLQKICAFSGLLPLFDVLTLPEHNDGRVSSGSHSSHNQLQYTENSKEGEIVEHSDKNQELAKVDLNEVKPLFDGITKFYIIKSLNYVNIEISQKYNVWATTRANTIKLSNAFTSCGNIILIFSVNESRHFQGYARMKSLPKKSLLPSVFGQDSSRYLGFNFEVTWLNKNELSFDKTSHLVNPWNNSLPIKISRDCQELPFNLGNYICSLILNNSVQHGESKASTGAIGGSSGMVASMEDIISEEEEKKKLDKRLSEEKRMNNFMEKIKKIQLGEVSRKNNVDFSHEKHQKGSNEALNESKSGPTAKAQTGEGNAKESKDDLLQKDHLISRYNEQQSFHMNKTNEDIQAEKIANIKSSNNCYMYSANEKDTINNSKHDDNLSSTTSSSKDKKRDKKSKKKRKESSEEGKKKKSKKDSKRSKDKKNKRKGGSILRDYLSDEKLIGFSEEFSDLNEAKYSRQKRFKADSSSYYNNKKHESQSYYKSNEHYSAKDKDKKRGSDDIKYDRMAERWNEYQMLVKENENNKC